MIYSVSTPVALIAVLDFVLRRLLNFATRDIAHYLGERICTLHVYLKDEQTLNNFSELNISYCSSASQQISRVQLSG